MWLRSETKLNAFSALHMGAEEHPHKNADVKISSYRYIPAKPKVKLIIKLKK